jgi:hypothetical protein
LLALRGAGDAAAAAHLAQRIAGREGEWGIPAALASLEAQRRQKQAERQRLAEVASAQQALVETLKERVDMRASLLKTDSGNKASVIDAKEQQQYHQTVLVERRGQLLEAEAAADGVDVTFMAGRFDPLG